MKNKLSIEEIAKICEASRRRVSEMTPEQRVALEKRARKTIKSGKKRF